MHSITTTATWPWFALRDAMLTDFFFYFPPLYTLARVSEQSPTCGQHVSFCVSPIESDRVSRCGREGNTSCRCNGPLLPVALTSLCTLKSSDPGSDRVKIMWRIGPVQSETLMLHEDAAATEAAASRSMERDDVYDHNPRAM